MPFLRPKLSDYLHHAAPSVRKSAKPETDSLNVPYTTYGQGFALNGTKSPVKLEKLNVG